MLHRKTFSIFGLAANHISSSINIFHISSWGSHVFHQLWRFNLSGSNQDWDAHSLRLASLSSLYELLLWAVLRAEGGEGWWCGGEFRGWGGGAVKRTGDQVNEGERKKTCWDCCHYKLFAEMVNSEVWQITVQCLQEHFVNLMEIGWRLKHFVFITEKISALHGTTCQALLPQKGEWYNRGNRSFAWIKYDHFDIGTGHVTQNWASNIATMPVWMFSGCTGEIIDSSIIYILTTSPRSICILVYIFTYGQRRVLQNPEENKRESHVRVRGKKRHYALVH